MRMPEAEVEVSVEVAGGLIAAQHPDLVGELTLVANGWDNVIFRLGNDLVVRLPRRAAAAQLVINEQRWLPLIAGRLPAPVPVPVRIGTPTPDYPWNWTIGRWLAGTAVTELPPQRRSGLAEPLAEFLAALHRPAPAVPDLPDNPVRGIPLAGRDELAESQLAGGAIPEADRVRAVWRRLVDGPVRTGPPVWVHGDPHPANLLTEQGRLAAVIDFGDITVGDPATDLATGWLTFDAAGRETFRRRYTRLTGADPSTWERARGWGLSIGLSLLANSDDNPQLAEVGRHALAQVLAEEDAPA